MELVGKKTVKNTNTGSVTKTNPVAENYFFSKKGNSYVKKEWKTSSDTGVCLCALYTAHDVCWNADTEPHVSILISVLHSRPT